MPHLKANRLQQASKTANQTVLHRAYSTHTPTNLSPNTATSPRKTTPISSNRKIRTSIHENTSTSSTNASPAFATSSQKMSHVENLGNGHTTGYRLQQSAYVNGRDASPFGHTVSDSIHDRTSLTIPGYHAIHSNDISGHRSRAAAVNFDTADKKQSKLKSILRLPNIIIRDTENNVTKSMEAPSPPRSMSYYHTILERRSNSQPPTSRSQSTISRSHSTMSSSNHKSKNGSGAHSTTSSALPQRNRRRRLSLEDDPNRLAMKMSLPCRNGCCYCVYAALLGPVRVYFTRADPPKKGPFLGGIKDGNGKSAIPVSRKSDVRGLVYDPKSHSFHPPARGQRPMFQEVRQPKKGKTEVKNKGSVHSLTNKTKV